MVRLKSNRWYSNENQRRLGRRVESDTSGRRRLISLIFLLALVILLMQKASDPRNVRNAFEALGVPLDRKPIASTKVDSDPGIEPLRSGERPVGERQSPVVSAGDQALWRATCDDLITRQLGGLTSEQTAALAEYWFNQGESPSDSRPPLDAWFESGREMVAQLQMKMEQSTEQHEDWLRNLQRFQEQWNLLDRAYRQSADGELPAATFRRELDPVFQHLVTQRLDQVLLQSLRDGSPWSGVERVVFWRLLQRGIAEELSDPAEIPLIPARQLDRSSSRYRGDWIRFQGSVRRVDRIQRSHPILNHGHYWVMWLRGADGSSQPVAVYSAHQLAEQLRSEVDQGRFPDVEIVGLVGKRLAYASQDGVQIAPTLFAGSIVQFAPERLAVERPGTAWLAWQIGTAGVAAVAISLLLLFPAWQRLRKTPVSKRLSRSGGLGIGLLVATAWQVSPTQAEQLTPPWSEQKSLPATPERIVEMRLAESFTEQELRNLVEFQTHLRAPVPAEIVKVMHSLEQVGWLRLWLSGQPMRVGDALQLVPIDIQAWAHSVQSFRLSEEQSEWFSVQPQSSISLLEIRATNTIPLEGTNGAPPPVESASSPGGSGQPLQVFCLRIPQQWSGQPALQQPVRIRGFALRVLNSEAMPEQTPEQSTICIFTDGPGWVFPQETSTEIDSLVPQISDRWYRLAKSGWDLSWLDLLAEQNQKPLAPEETLPLINLLRLGLNQANALETDSIEPIEVLRSPIENIAAPIDWKVRLVTGTLVQLDGQQNPQLKLLWREQQSSDKATVGYYQFDGFVKLPGHRINYLTADQRQNILFEGEYPITVLIHEDSPLVDRSFLQDRSGLTGGTSWEIGRTARVSGRFFRMWSYRSQRLSGRSGDERQVAPLLIASSIRPASPDPVARSPVGWFGYALTGGVTLIMIGILLLAFSDASRKRRGRKSSAVDPINQP
jgi:hypothetical protein